MKCKEVPASAGITHVTLHALNDRLVERARVAGQDNPSGPVWLLKLFPCLDPQEDLLCKNMYSK